MDKSTPPPQKPIDIPDYYLGMLIDYEPMSHDSCKWVVYDGHSKVRCVSRASAISYITERRRLRTSDTTATVNLARYYVNKACNLLEQSARKSVPTDRLLLDYLAVQLKPIIVNIDNYLTHEQAISNNQDKRQDQPEDD